MLEKLIQVQKIKKRARTNCEFYENESFFAVFVFDFGMRTRRPHNVALIQKQKIKKKCEFVRKWIIFCGSFFRVGMRICGGVWVDNVL